MNTTEIRDRFLSEMQDACTAEGWDLSDEAGDCDDLARELCDLTPDPEAYDDPTDYLGAIRDYLSIDASFRDDFDHLKTDLIWTATAHRIYEGNTDECEDALRDIYSDLSEAAEGCDTISDLIEKAADCFIRREWDRFVAGVEIRLSDVLDDIESEIPEDWDDEDED